MQLDVLYNKSCQRMTELPDKSIDLIATDPPFGIGFMGRKWDAAIPSIDIWKECLRVLKPGAFAFIMCIPRQDCLSRMIVSLEEAGFMASFTPIFHAFASGFPKSRNISKAVDKKFKGKRQVVGQYKRPDNTPRNYEKWNKSNSELNFRSDKSELELREITKSATPQAEALDGSYAGFSPKPAVEVILFAMKPLSEKSYTNQALKNRKGITWLDEGKIPYEKGNTPRGGYGAMDIGIGKPMQHQAYRRPDSIIAKNPHTRTKGSKAYDTHCYGKYNPKDDYTDYTKQIGRFPANLLVSNNALSNGKITKSRPHGGNGKSLDTRGMGWGFKRLPCSINDSGSFSRYFSLDAWFEKKFKELPKGVQKTFPFLIVPKASKSEKNEGCEKLYWEKDSSSFGYHQIDKRRWIELGQEEERIYKGTGKRVSLRAKGNIHPTVKPLKLFSYLIILGSREGDVILDPFFGSGTSGVAARMLARHYIGYEIGKENMKIAKARLSTVESMLI